MTSRRAQRTRAPRTRAGRTRPRYLRPEARYQVPPACPAPDLPEPPPINPWYRPSVADTHILPRPEPEPRFFATVVREGHACVDCGDRVVPFGVDRCESCRKRQERETSGDDAMFDRLGYGLEDDHE